MCRTARGFAFSAPARDDGLVSIDYTHLPGFEGVALEDSYTLDIEAHPGTLVLRLDLLLLPGHPAWEPAKPGERACFKVATLSFSKVRSLHWDGMGVKPTLDPSGTLDFGSMDSLTKTGRQYRIEGDWGQITVEADAPCLSVESTAT